MEEFVGIIVVIALFAAYTYFAFRFSMWIFKRGVQKELEQAEQVSEEEKLRRQKEEIASRLLDEYKKKELEEQVRRELVEKGELPPEEGQAR